MYWSDVVASVRALRKAARLSKAPFASRLFPSASTFAWITPLEICPAGTSPITLSFHGRSVPYTRAAVQIWLGVVWLPRHLVEAHAAQTLEVDPTPVDEREAPAGHQVLHHLRDEDLAGLGARADAE